MRIQPWFTRVTLAVLVMACADQPTEVVLERELARDPKTIWLATSSSDDGLSITTDKDDYSPGDTVWFTGAGWPAGDTLDVELVDEPMTHEPHTWWVPVDETGGFRDWTYVVDIGDLNVTFTLTATSRATGRRLTVVFTDGQLRLTAPEVPGGFVSVPFSPGVLGFTASNSANPFTGHDNVSILIRVGTSNLNPTLPTLVRTLTPSPALNLAAGATGSVGSWNGKNDVSIDVAEGLYTARVRSSQQGEDDNGNRRVAIVVDRTPPGISNPVVLPNSIVSGSNTAVTLTAISTDPTALGVDAGHYKVLSADYRIDGTGVGGMAAADGSFNGRLENLTVTVPGLTIAGLSPGSHQFCVRATDAATNAGAFTITGNPNCATLEITNADAQAPTISCTMPNQAIWYTNNVTVPCTAFDGGSGLQNPTDASFSLSTSVAAGTETNTAQTNARQVCDNKGNCATSGPYPFMVDKKDPQVSCGTADGVWHASDVFISCTASDGGSGLANSADATFSLATNVASGTEMNTASTNSKSVVDAVGNSATAGPIGGNKVDKKAPVVSCGAADGTWHTDDVFIACAASDGGSGLNNAGDASFNLTTSVLNGTETSSASTSSKSVADAVGNSATAGPIGGIKVDKKAPVVSCGAADGTWHTDDVSIACAASDGGSGLNNAEDASFNLTTSVLNGTETSNALTDSRSVLDAVGHGSTAGPIGGNKVDKKAPVVSCGAADGTWHTDDVSIACAASDGGSGLNNAEDASFNLTTSVLNGTETSSASTSSKSVADAVGNSATAGPIGGNKVDKKAPVVSCGAADGMWHASDVSIGCTASDGGSGLADAGDAGFSLTTSVPNGTETSNALTDSRSVLDAVGHGSTAGAIAGNRVDKKAPVVVLTCPASSVILGAPASASWTSTDGGSGVATGYAAGSIALQTGSVGPKTATALAGTSEDNVDNNSLAVTCGYSVAYNFVGLSAPVDRPNTMNVSKAGQAIPLKWRLTDYNGTPVLNFSPAALGVAVSGLQCTVSTALDQIEEYTGASGLQNLGDGYYQFNWKTPASYANLCKSIGLDLGEGTPRGPLAYFQFKK